MADITIHTHGYSEGNPGPAVIAVCAMNDKSEVVVEFTESIGNATDVYAEYAAIVRALQELKNKLGDKSKGLEYELVLCDEKVKRQLNAEEQVKDVSLVGYFMEIYNLRVEAFPYLTPAYYEDKDSNLAIKLFTKA